jgi:hypothetical protein
MAAPTVMLAFTIPAVAACGGRIGIAVIVSANKPGVNGPALPAGARFPSAIPRPGDSPRAQFLGDLGRLTHPGADQLERPIDASGSGCSAALAAAADAPAIAGEANTAVTVLPSTASVPSIREACRPGLTH